MIQNVNRCLEKGTLFRFWGMVAKPARCQATVVGSARRAATADRRAVWQSREQGGTNWAVCRVSASGHGHVHGGQPGKVLATALSAVDAPLATASSAVETIQPISR